MIDEVKVRIKAGKGGRGSKSASLFKFQRRKKPDGGDGGHGGDIYLLTDGNMNTLYDYNKDSLIASGIGGNGGSQGLTGKNAPDLVLKVPRGTQYSFDNLEFFDLPDKTPVRIAKGGKGGRGSKHFKKLTEYPYVKAEPGEEPEIKDVYLKLTILADIGLVGLPSSGKSTLINKLTNSKSKVGNYPFTTLYPKLGIYRNPSGRDLVIADIPGIIENASKGKGLGIQFLKHISKTSILLLLIEATDFVVDGEINVSKGVETIKLLEKELNQFSNELSLKERLILITKSDLITDTELNKLKNKLNKNNLNFIIISAKSGFGIPELCLRLNDLAIEESEVKKEKRVYTIKTLLNKHSIVDNL